MWATICVSSAVVMNKNLTHFFRVQVHGDQYGETSCKFLNEISKAKLGKDPKDLKVAIIYEDSPYGAGIGASSDLNCKALGIQVALKEGYSATAPDLSSMVTKLRRANADVILHTGYNPDITLFWRQAREQGLKWSALIGHGAGYAQYDKLHAAFGKDADLIFNVDPAAAQLLDPKTLKPGLGDVTKEMIKRYTAQVTDRKVDEVPPHVSMGFNHTYVFLTDVLPRAIKKYGGIGTDALRKAALDTDIPVGGTIQGYGVKFFPPGTPMSGQNERSAMVVMQYINNDTKIVYPTAIKTADPVLPLPKGHTYAPQ
jgi:branched-chain amino acid transport system substrate-binding protein